MIPLRLPLLSTSLQETTVVRLNSSREHHLTENDLSLAWERDGRLTYVGERGQIEIAYGDPSELDGDVLLLIPERRFAHRLIRATSPHNTLLITERCDQLCVMCSQPPKNYEMDPFAELAEACRLAPHGAVLGLTGGEPTLYKDQLLSLLDDLLVARPDLSFHVLSNAQHFTESDVAALRALPVGKIVWGVPIYAADAGLHDRIVGKVGAFQALLSSLSILGRAGISLELRTVLMASNARQLPLLAGFLGTMVPFAQRWAIMQMEYFGFARKVWAEEFYDSSADFGPVANAINIARARGLDAILYNFPRCTVPRAFRELAPATISDWKRKYLEACGRCTERQSCGGLFEWHPVAHGFRELAPL